MKNFYFVLTYNVTHPRVSEMLGKIGFLDISESIVDFKVRSKLYHEYDEALESTGDDFDKKLSGLYGDEADNMDIHIFTVTNPAFCDEQDEALQEYGASALVWEEHCCAAVFFVEGDHNPEGLMSADNEEDVEEEEPPLPRPREWMFKYEVYFTDDPIEFTKNGEYLFNPMDISFQSTSSYH